MSLATRCPACGTTFKVVRDQLRISDGWVRCGRCSNVFDGAAHLHESPPPPAASPEVPPPVEATTPVPDPTPAPTSSVSSSPVPGGWVSSSPPAEANDAALQPPPTPTDTPPPNGPEAIAEITAEAPTRALADIDFFSDALLRLSTETLPSGGYAASPPAPPPTITDHIPQPPRSQPVALEAPSLSWPAFTQYAPVAAVPVIEFPPDAVASDAAPAVLRNDDSWSRLPSLHLGEVPAAPQRDASGDGTLPPPPDADDAQFQKALRRARIKSLKIARARAKGNESETPAVVLTPSEATTEAAAIDAGGPAASRAPSPMSAMQASRSTRGARLDAATPTQRRSRWRRPLRVAALAGLLLLLAAQVLHQERNAIVARQPSMRPLFASACEWLGCQLSALRQIADIRIDGASFAREKSGEGYQFSFTLRNLASIPLAMPAVELSLLDTQERTVVRRVLRPADYGAPATLAAHAERATLLPVLVAGEDAAALPRVAGFRLDAFYP